MQSRGHAGQFTVVTDEETANEGGLEGIGEIAIDWRFGFLEAAIEPGIEGLNENGGSLR